MAAKKGNWNEIFVEDVLASPWTVKKVGYFRIKKWLSMVRVIFYFHYTYAD